MSFNQKEGVFSVVSEMCVIENSVCELGDKRDLVVNRLCEMFVNDEIEMSEKGKEKYFNKPKELRKYVGGLLNNWMRKDKRLNGGSRYITKNPGSRTGSGDKVLKNLKLLRSTLSDESKIAEIDKVIEKRVEEIRVEKLKDVEVDMSLISDELKKKLGIEEES